MTNMNEGLLLKGFKSSEFWMAAAVIIPYFSNQLGIDLGAVIAVITQSQHDIQVVQSTSQAPALVAAVYVAGRTWLKHKRMV